MSEASPTADLPKLDKAAFTSDQTVRWCPGCGDYAILSAMQRTLPGLGVTPEKYVFVSGIGCASRFPYYMNTYGFHTIHGRAPAFATGIKCANPDLNVWVITGDGDALSIGGNHFIHVIRRNIDINYVLFNNRIYGLTKGQYSPTSELGKVTKSSPAGSLERPIEPITLAAGANATFIARALDKDVKGMQAVFERAQAHKGTSFVEIYQNCNIFNDGTFDKYADKSQRPETTVWLEHGKPLVFGKEKDKGICVKNCKDPQVVKLSEAGTDNLLIHDEGDELLTFIYEHMTESPHLPTPFGVFRSFDRPCYEDGMFAQLEEAKAKKGTPDLQDLLLQGATWDVE